MYYWLSILRLNPLARARDRVYDRLMRSLNAIRMELMELDKSDRTELALSLIESVGTPSFELSGKAYEKEVYERAQRSYEQGPSGKPWEEIEADLRAKLK